MGNQKGTRTGWLGCLEGTALTDLDLAVDAFMDHPMRTRGTHVTIPHQNRVGRFDHLELVRVAGQTVGGDRHGGWSRLDWMGGRIVDTVAGFGLRSSS